jgi:glycogen operon protein
VDGFRFDLASILGRGRDGSVLANPPVLEQIAADPVLAGTKLIAEAWDAAGLYQVGSFPAWGRWAEWNGRFRDDIRKFVKGDPGMVPALATRLAGSADLYQGSGRAPFHSINFVTCHDGFTLADLVSFNHKHNQANGEDNRDGSNENDSWNCGAEGSTDDPQVLALRRRQARNLAALLVIAHGTPMILAGDEMGHSQKGNNNGYCQDSDLSWIDWQQADPDFHRFVRTLIGFRSRHAILRRTAFVGSDSQPGPSLSWHGQDLYRPDWSSESRLLALHLQADGQSSSDQIYVIANAHWEGHDCEVPELPQGPWRRFLDTSIDGRETIAEPGAELAIAPGRYSVSPRSVVILTADRKPQC